MYTSMLEEAVGRLKGEERVERPSVQLSLGIPLRIDESYIAEENQRLRMYKRIAGVENEKALEDVRTELEDRYGPPPVSVAHLLEAARLRMECERIGVAQVDRKRDQLHIRFTEMAAVDPGRLMKLVAKNAKKGAQFTPQGVLKFPLAAVKPDDVLAEVRALLVELADSSAQRSAVSVP
jgi:transcription-repair coupling factor (superfamily II helicase)